MKKQSKLETVQEVVATLALILLTTGLGLAVTAGLKALIRNWNNIGV